MDPCFELRYVLTSTGFNLPRSRKFVSILDFVVNSLLSGMDHSLHARPKDDASCQ